MAKLTNRKKRRNSRKIYGTSVLMWIFLFILLIALCVFIGFMCYGIYHELHTENPEIDFTGIALGVCGVLATIVIGINIFTYVDFKSVERKVKELDSSALKIKTDAMHGFEEALAERCRTDGDHSRMHAFFLKEMGRPAWAIGWISRAVKLYYTCSRERSLGEISYKPIAQSCLLILVDCVRKFTSKSKEAEKKLAAEGKDFTVSGFLGAYKKDNDEPNIAVFKRTFKDVMDYMIIVDEDNDTGNNENLTSLVDNLRPDKKQNAILESFRAFMFIVLQETDRESIDECREDSYFRAEFNKKIKMLRKEVKDKDVKELFIQLKNGVASLS